MSKYKYDYSPLKSVPAEFRLVTITPGVRPAYIEVTLSTHLLSAAPPYEALSYVWGSLGSVDDPDVISMDGFIFEVTTNLWKSLYALRDSTKPRTMWIDAICIDQDDLEERSSQVLLMGEIYKQAQRSVIWLGEEGTWTAELFRLLEGMGRVRTWNGEDERLEVEATNQQLRDRLLTDTKVQRYVNRGLYADLAQRDFWSRIWVIQEVALAKEVLVLCGPYSMDFQVFSDRIWTLDQLAANVMPRENLGYGGLPNLETMTIVRELLQSGISFSLSDVLACFRRANSTNPLDMIYGLLGLVANSTIKPNYTSASILDVYVDLLSESLASTNSLDIITLCRRTTSQNNLPSWVPDWTESWRSEDVETDEDGINDHPCHPLILKYGTGEMLRAFLVPPSASIVQDRNGVEVTLTAWNAHGNTPPCAAISRESSTLTAAGVSIGKITSIGDYTIRDEEDGELFLCAVLGQWETIVLERFGLCLDTVHDTSILQILDRAVELLNHYLIANGVDTVQELEEKTAHRNRNRELFTSTFPPSTEPYISGCSVPEAYLRTLAADLDSDSQRISPAQCAEFFSTQPSPEWQDILFAFQPGTNRRFCITDTGYMGLAPVRAEVGDTVAVVWGCSVPVVLRTRAEGEGVKLVGEAYVHGIMDGEVVELKKTGRVREERWVVY